MLDLRRLRYFVTVAEELHFGRAAERLRIAQPPLTRHISALETELGIRLFERSTRAVSLTTAGAQFLEQARHVVNSAREAEETARKIAQGVVGRLAIGYASSIPMSDAFSTIVKIASRNLPELELAFREVPTASQYQQILAGALDIGFGWSSTKATGQGIRSLIVQKSALVAAVPSQSPHAHKASIDFTELAEEPFISWPSGYGSALSTALDELCAQSGISPRLGPSASQIATAVSFVAAERGVAIVPDFVSTLQRPGVAYVPLDGSHVMEQTVSWIEPFSSRGVERFVELAGSHTQFPA